MVDPTPEMLALARANEPTAEELALARKCVADHHARTNLVDENGQKMILAGKFDHWSEIQIALAAIREATELSAKLVDDLNKHGPYMAIGAAQALRSYAHLKDTSHADA